MSTTANGTTVTYTRDATDRIITRTEESSTLRYSYSSAGDSPDMVMDLNNTVVDKMVDLVGGVVKNTHLENNTYSDKYSHPNIHGDVIVLTDSSGTKQGTTKTYDPFGEALGDIPDNLSGNADLGWLGGKDRLTEHFGSVRTIQMGQRQYVPGLGRFLEVDPVEGGSANDYDYCDADPIGCVDLDGTIGWKRFFKAAVSVAAVVVTVVAIAACGATVVCGVAVGAAVGAGTYAAHRAIDRKRITSGGLARAAALGAITGGKLRTGHGIGFRNHARIAVHGPHKQLPSVIKPSRARRLLAKHNYHKHVKVTWRGNTKAFFLNDRKLVRQKVWR